MRGKAAAGYIRPTIKQFFTSSNFEEIESTVEAKIIFDTKIKPGAVITNSGRTVQFSGLGKALAEPIVSSGKIYFEIDNYDLNFINRKKAIEDQYIWKCNYIGGGRIYQLIKYLKKERTLEDYLTYKKTKNAWKFGVGYFIGKKLKTADYITNRPNLETKHFTEKGIEKKSIEYEKFFEAPRVKDIYEPPHLLIKCSIGKKNTIPVELFNEGERITAKI